MTTTQADEYTEQDLKDMLPIYYKRLFPKKVFFSWLCYNRSEPQIMANREFSFTLANDIYIRYLSFDTLAEFEAELYAKVPFKIDIGAVMNIKPRINFVSSLRAVQRELIFDIDMTDYDAVRTCCSNAEICQKCWKFMVVACRIIDETLHEDFNFEHILWVFSGRRGIHCWVCDKIARHLDPKNRTAIVEYLNFQSPQNNVVIGDRMHHSLKRAHTIINSYFDEICLTDQNLFATQKGRKMLLDFISDESVRKELEQEFLELDTTDSKIIWEAFKQCNLQRTRKPKFWLEEIQMAILCPRLDINVSKTTNHLLKAPFCVHPKTGKICIPFNASVVHKFDPTTVPTIRQLLKEIDEFDKEAGDSNRILGYRKTGMYKGVLIFEEFLRKLDASSSNNAKLEHEDAKMEF